MQAVTEKKKFHYQCPIKRSVDVRQSEILNKRAVRSPIVRKWGRLFIYLFLF